MYKSPKYKSIETNSVKDRQKYFKNLYDEVNKSRMAVQTITSFKNTEMNFKRKIDDIQEQLHSSMSRINHQTKKNAILKQLVNLMKGEMFDFQKTLKRQEQKNQSEAQKKIKKIQYDIQQILQKHNQQIAKITSLKQSANSGRSERVVFSNLFKKLEKQIKQNQESYKQNLIKSQIAKDKSKPSKSLARLAQKDNYLNIENNRHSQTNIDIFPIDAIFSASNEHDAAFITLQRQRSFDGQNKRYNYNDKKNTIYQQENISEAYDTKNSSKGFNQMMGSYENFLQKIKVYIGCQDINQAVPYYQDIQLANQSLSSQIETYNDQISKCQGLIKDIHSQKRQSQCYENSKQLPLGSFRRLKVFTQTDEDLQQTSPEQIINILNDLGSSLNLDILAGQVNEEVLKNLDSKLDLFLEQSKFNDELIDGDLSSKNRATTTTSQGNAVDILLEKMDRFSECEKLLDKHLFKQQYLKELNKNKKHKTKK